MHSENTALYNRHLESETKESCGTYHGQTNHATSWPPQIAGHHANQHKTPTIQRPCTNRVCMLFMKQRQTQHNTTNSKGHALQKSRDQKCQAWRHSCQTGLDSLVKAGARRCLHVNDEMKTPATQSMNRNTRKIMKSAYSKKTKIMKS